MRNYSNLTILKIGGSVMTHKDGDSDLNVSLVRQTLAEIGQWQAENPHHPLILISGAGSFGHPLAHQYQLNRPTAAGKEAIGFARIARNMLKMGLLIADLAEAVGVPLLPLQPSALFVTDSGRISQSFLQTVDHALQNGVVPFLWGDVAFDESHRFCILSGDQILPYLYTHFGAENIYFGTNVAGIYTDNPKTNPAATIIAHISDDNYDRVRASLSASSDVDVTGGMFGKIEEIRRVATGAIACKVYDARVLNNTYRALSGQAVGSHIEFGKSKK
jgi:isopentenyl phosphate kinase